MFTLTYFDQTVRLDRTPLRSTTCRRQTRRQLSRAQRCDTRLDTWLDINGRDGVLARRICRLQMTYVCSGGRLRQMVSARRTTVAYQLESIPHISVTSHSVVEFSPSPHHLTRATVANVHRDDDRSVGRTTTWLCCRFRECPPDSIDTTAGLMVESEDSF